MLPNRKVFIVMFTMTMIQSFLERVYTPHPQLLQPMKQWAHMDCVCTTVIPNLLDIISRAGMWSCNLT